MYNTSLPGAPRLQVFGNADDHDLYRGDRIRWGKQALLLPDRWLDVPRKKDYLVQIGEDYKEALCGRQNRGGDSGFTGGGITWMLFAEKQNRRYPGLFKWIKRLFVPSQQHGMITRTCRNCGRTFSLPENVQYWPDYCQECRLKAPEQKITRKCRGCGKIFSFSSSLRRWPKYCRECQARRKH